MDVTEARAFLKKCRDENDRQSSKIVDVYRDVLSDSMKSLGDERWVVYEQVALASFDTRDWEVSKQCLQQLSHQYPGSHRIRKLKAMQLEALGAYTDAEKIYDALLAEDEANSSVHKRKIAILKAQELIPEAIEKLCEYLKKFQSDQEAWLELSNLYIEENDFPKAAFCMEELLLTSPHNHLYHQRYAELQYLIGTVDSVELARAYFAQALKFNPQNKEALFGFCSAAQWLASSTKLASQKKKDNQKYLTWAIDQIKTLYQKEIGALEGKDVAVEDLMAKLSIKAAPEDEVEANGEQKKAD
ncbi:ER membrane protein complex subunit 2 isoform X2 [Galendromus occidentalis]|uniref:ER membrane protein complex subunit 2 n=1 Tax=Galendromus occidentalis TaxID=34638 RepID=A0AAJ6QTZ7_9ACAR|nr:ER membrane protein complex subunit 2 isoform X2 [Galendromus occidentalis]